MNRNGIFESNDQVMMQSMIHTGNNYRIKKVIRKARNNEPITIAYLGGSVTEGYKGGEDGGYANLSCHYFKNCYSGGKVNYINAGMSGTGSVLGLIRLERDVLQYQPDIVFVEFAINDTKDTLNKEAYECILRKLLQAEQQPAVILVMLRNQSGYTCQGQMQAVGEYYDLPIISINDAITPELEVGSLLWSDYSEDYAHPNQSGHSFISRCISYYYETADHLPQDPGYQLPEAAFYGLSYLSLNRMDSSHTYGITQGSFLANQTIKEFSEGWTHKNDAGNDSFILEINTEFLFIVYKECNDPMEGSAQVYIDGEYRYTLSGYQTTGWGNPAFRLLFLETVPKIHKIEVRMSPGDEQKEFSILAFGYGR